MACVFDIKLEASDVVAILAFLVSALSALYARWSWREAKKSNQISLLSHKKEIYDAFFELKMHMLQRAEFAEIGEVSKFYYHSRNAKIYLPSELAKDIEKYYDACFWIADIHRRYDGTTKESGIECEQYVKVERELSPKIEKEITSLLQAALV